MQSPMPPDGPDCVCVCSTFLTDKFKVQLIILIVILEKIHDAFMSIEQLIISKFILRDK
jgi:hypothetical protein